MAVIRRRSWAPAIAGAGIGVLLLSACSSSTTGSSETPAMSSPPSPSVAESSEAPATCDLSGKVIAYVGPLKTHPVLQVMAAGFVKGAEGAGLEPKVMLADDADPQKVLTLGKQAISQGVDGIVLQPYDPSLYGLVKEATAAGIPVTLTHFDSPTGQADGASAVFMPDPPQYAAEAAKDIAKTINGAGTVALTQGGFNSTENDVAKVFTETMAQVAPDVKVLKPQEEGFDPAKAISKAVSILQGNPDVVAAFSTTGGGPTTWAGAAKETGRNIVAIGMDYTRPNLDLVKAGDIHAVVAQPIFEEHEQAAQALADVMCGKSVSYSNKLPSALVTKENVDQFYAILDKAGS